MNPVVGLDVAKGESQVQAFLDQSKPYGKSFSMKHTREELDQFIGFLKEIEEVTKQMPMVILESTGHYYSPVIQYMEEHEILYILLNPIISYQAKKTSLRKVKTDAIDAYQLCVLYYKEDFEPHKNRGRFECANGKVFDFDNPLHAEIPVITKVIFKDRNGNLYSIAPNHIGLKFAKGEMNYKEYKRIQKKDMAQGLGIVFITTGTFFSIGWAFVELMT